jgi:hypothetical protein
VSVFIDSSRIVSAPLLIKLKVSIFVYMSRILNLMYRGISLMLQLNSSSLEL